MSFRLVSECEEMNPRRRSTMEDVHRIVRHLGGDASLSYFGVYDGHGGRQIVDFLETNLEKNIITELGISDNASVLERLERAFLITDIMSKQGDMRTSGATAVSVLLKDADDGDKIIYVANVGDSRAVLCCQRNKEGLNAAAASGFWGLRLSVDHRPDNDFEQDRINDAGGFIARGRVLGILAVTRSFGDHGMKDFVIAKPHLEEIRLSSVGDCPFIILACDGVWDVMTDQEAVDMIYTQYLALGPFEDAAKLLVHTAIERGSADNVTAIVTFI